MREVGGGGLAVLADGVFGDDEEQELTRFGGGVGGGAEVAGGDAGVEEVGEWIVGVELGAGSAVGVEVGEDADGCGAGAVDEDLAEFVRGEDFVTDLVRGEGDVEALVGDGLVGLGVEDADGEAGWEDGGGFGVCGSVRGLGDGGYREEGDGAEVGCRMAESGGTVVGVPQSLSFVLVHIVFSTKGRRPWLGESVRAGVHAYLSVAAREVSRGECFRVGGTADHVHLAIRMHPAANLAKVVQEVKRCSSKWMKEQGVTGFAWQRGYGAFSVGPADLGALLRYIDAQEAHHRRRGFQEEMRGFFEKYHVAFDERYVWD